MPRVGITGHARLSEQTTKLVYDALASYLRPLAGPELLGVTCLCPGADQIFAQVVTDVDGRYDVVLPAADYRERAIAAEQTAAFDDLLEQARSVQFLPCATADRAAFKAASEEMLRRSDLLLAVWDGQPSRQVGDAADVVATARRRGVPVCVIWPPGARRE